MNQNEAVTQSLFDGTWGGSSTATTKVGQLNPDQASAFIDYVFDQSVLPKVARIIRMNAPQARIGKMDIGVKPLRPAVRGTDPGVTSQSSVSEIVLQTKELIAEAQILDDELEDNTEKGALMDHFMRVLGVRIGNQLEQAYLTAINTNGSPVALDINQLFTGWMPNIRLNGGHQVDGSTVGGWADRYLSSAKLSKLIKSVPAKYKTRALDYRLLMSPNAYQDYVDLVASRQTVGGDQAFRAAGFEQNLPFGQPSVLGYGSYPIYPVPLLPENEFVASSGSTTSAAVANANQAVMTMATGGVAAAGIVAGSVLRIGNPNQADGEVLTVQSIAGDVVTFTTNFVYPHASGILVTRGTADGTAVILTHFQNFLIGIQRDIRIELDRRPRERATYAVVTLRVDCQMENPDATAIVNNLAIR